MALICIVVAQTILAHVPETFYCIPMGSKRMDSVRDLRRWNCRFHAECKACGHYAVLSADDLELASLNYRVWFGDPGNLRFLASKLKCSKCRSKRVDWGVAEIPKD